MIVMVMAASAAAGAAAPPPICQVGRVALRDLASLNRNPHGQAYFAGADANHRDLLSACPQLGRVLPPGLRLAHEDAWSRVGIQTLLVGPPRRPTTIFHVDVPKLSPDRERATVGMGYVCGGLCGAGFVAHYVRTAHRWRRVGPIRLMAIS